MSSAKRESESSSPGWKVPGIQMVVGDASKRNDEDDGGDEEGSRP